MTSNQVVAPLRAPRQTINMRLAEYFRKRPRVWCDGRDLARVAGFAAWRTRVSDLRKPPFLMTIENQQIRVCDAEGRVTFVRSEYMFIPTHESTQ